MEIVNVVRGILNVCSFLTLIVLIYYIKEFVSGLRSVAKKKTTFKDMFKSLNKEVFNLFKTKDDEGNPISKLNIAVGIAIISSVIYVVGSYAFPSTQIGSLFEMDEYEEYYYVYLYPENSNDKNYKVKAKIWVYTEKYDDGDDGYDTQRMYLLRTVTFDNGDTIDFDWYDDAVEIGKKVSVTDNQGKDWKAELTTSRVIQDR